MAKEKETQEKKDFSTGRLSSFLATIYNTSSVFAPVRIEYDDIVDTSNFRLSSEIIRDKVASGNVGAGEQGIFDFQADEKVTKENMPTDVELALRSGKLDKADVQKLQKLYDDKAQSDVETERTKSALEAERKASKKRSDKVDEMLGVNNTLEDSRV